MNRFQKSKKKDKSIIYRLILPLVVFAAVIVIFINSANHMQETSKQQQYEALNSALTKNIVHCYATEGFYPPSLKYIQDHYQLTYNHDLFFVDYQPMGANMMPELTIIQRKGNL